MNVVDRYETGAFRDAFDRWGAENEDVCSLESVTIARQALALLSENLRTMRSWIDQGNHSWNSEDLQEVKAGIRQYEGIFSDVYLMILGRRATYDMIYEDGDNSLVPLRPVGTNLSDGALGGSTLLDRNVGPQGVRHLADLSRELLPFLAAGRFDKKRHGQRFSDATLATVFALRSGTFSLKHPDENFDLDAVTDMAAILAVRAVEARTQIACIRFGSAFLPVYERLPSSTPGERRTLEDLHALPESQRSLEVGRFFLRHAAYMVNSGRIATHPSTSDAEVLWDEATQAFLETTSFRPPVEGLPAEDTQRHRLVFQVPGASQPTRARAELWEAMRRQSRSLTVTSFSLPPVEDFYDSVDKAIDSLEVFAQILEREHQRLRALATSPEEAMRMQALLALADQTSSAWKRQCRDLALILDVDDQFVDDIDTLLIAGSDEQSVARDDPTSSVLRRLRRVRMAELPALAHAYSTLTSQVGDAMSEFERQWRSERSQSLFNLPLDMVIMGLVDNKARLALMTRDVAGGRVFEKLRSSGLAGDIAPNSDAAQQIVTRLGAYGPDARVSLRVLGEVLDAEDSGVELSETLRARLQPATPLEQAIATIAPPDQRGWEAVRFSKPIAELRAADAEIRALRETLHSSAPDHLHDVLSQAEIRFARAILVLFGEEVPDVLPPERYRQAREAFSADDDVVAHGLSLDGPLDGLSAQARRLRTASDAVEHTNTAGWHPALATAHDAVGAAYWTKTALVTEALGRELLQKLADPPEEDAEVAVRVGTLLINVLSETDANGASVNTGDVLQKVTDAVSGLIGKSFKPAFLLEVCSAGTSPGEATRRSEEGGVTLPDTLQATLDEAWHLLATAERQNNTALRRSSSQEETQAAKRVALRIKALRHYWQETFETATTPPLPPSSGATELEQNVRAFDERNARQTRHVERQLQRIQRDAGVLDADGAHTPHDPPIETLSVRQYAEHMETDERATPVVAAALRIFSAMDDQAKQQRKTVIADLGTFVTDKLAPGAALSSSDVESVGSTFYGNTLAGGVRAALDVSVSDLAQRTAVSREDEVDDSLPSIDATGERTRRSGDESVVITPLSDDDFDFTAVTRAALGEEATGSQLDASEIAGDSTTRSDTTLELTQGELPSRSTRGRGRGGIGS